MWRLPAIVALLFGAFLAALGASALIRAGGYEGGWHRVAIGVAFLLLAARLLSIALRGLGRGRT